MQFEFDKELMPKNMIEIENLGDFGLEMTNSEGYFWYLAVRTVLGSSFVAACGPVIPDIDLIPSGFKITIDRLQYKEDKLSKFISTFLNDKTRSITEAKILSFEDAAEQFRDVKEYIKNIDLEAML